MPTSSYVVKLILISFTLISVVISSKDYLNDDLNGIFRSYRSKNIKTEAIKVNSNSLTGLVAEGKKKADCYGRGGYRTYGGGGSGGGGPPIIIIGGGGVPGAGGVIPGTGAGGGGAGGIPVPGAGGSVPVPGAGGAVPVPGAGGTIPVPSAGGSGSVTVPGAGTVSGGGTVTPTG